MKPSGGCRVHVVAGDGSELFGVVLSGERLPDGRFDLDCTFTMRCDDGDVMKVRGWLCETERLSASPRAS